MSQKTGKEVLYFNFFKRLFETLEKSNETLPKIKPNESTSPLNQKTKEFDRYVNSILNKQLDIKKNS